MKVCLRKKKTICLEQEKNNCVLAKKKRTKKLSFINSIVFVVNSIAAGILLLSYLSYYISPNQFAFIPFLSLSIPILIIINVLFIIYWLLGLKRHFLLSTIVLLIGFQYVNRFYNLSEKKVLLTSDTKIMSYNVRMFNLYKWIDQEDIPKQLYSFINDKDPDILAIQEFQPDPELGFDYPYKYVQISEKNKQFGHAIFSKFKIINSGTLDFDHSSNTTIFVDIVKNKDTLRIYNVHLESLKINPKKENFDKEIDEKFLRRVEASFKKQAEQTSIIKNHIEQFNGKSIICGDFNNTAFSWSYHQLLENKNDAFEIAGKGFGSTYNTFFPMRIDFILTDKSIEVNNFKTFSINYSDHYPILARIQF